MEFIKKLMITCLMAGPCLSVWAQTFTNLDFEQVTLIGTPTPYAASLAGWTGYLGTEVLAPFIYNNETLSCAAISIIGTNYDLGRLVPHGSYCLLLQAGEECVSYPPPSMVSAAIEQTGTIPASARKIVFDTSPFGDMRDVRVTFNETPIPLGVQVPGSDIFVVGGDISTFAGQSGELRFTAPVYSDYYSPQVPVWNRASRVIVDHIRFSSTPLTAAPVVLTSPRSGTGLMGREVSFQVAASGYPEPSYQWFFQATNLLVGATQSTLELTNIQVSQSGLYHAVVSNAYGTATSQPATLTVRDPFFAWGPGYLTIDAGQTALLSAQPVGTPPLAFQWLKNGMALADGGNISGTHSTNLVIGNVLGSDAGSYSMIVSNLYGSATSSVAKLTVRDPVIVSQLNSRTAEVGSMVGFRLSVAGTDPLCQWYFNSQPLGSATTNMLLRLTDVQPVHAGSYVGVVSSAFGSVASSVAALNVIPRVERRQVPALGLPGQEGALLHLQSADALGSWWLDFAAVPLVTNQQFCPDLSMPLPSQRFFRSWQDMAAGPTVLQMSLATELTLTGAIGGRVRVDYINQIGPTDAWVTLNTVTLTNTTQSYVDFTSYQQPARLYRLVPVP